jgi:hypothetical protein
MRREILVMTHQKKKLLLQMLLIPRQMKATPLKTRDKHMI